MSIEQEKRKQAYRERDYVDYSYGRLTWPELLDRWKQRQGMTLDKMMEIYDNMEKRRDNR